MTLIEIISSTTTIVFALALISALLLLPELHQPAMLLPLAGIGLLVNVGLMVVVLRDILLRRFAQPTDKYLWLALVLLVWPSIIIYLLRHGFKARQA